MLKSREKNRRKYYRINPHFPLLHEFTSIIRKTDETNETLLKKLSKLGDIDLCVLSGSFVDNNSDIDLFVVGTVTDSDLKNFTKEHFKNEEIASGVMTKEDFLYRITL